MTKEIISFQKSPLSISAQITLLQKRGLIINDLEKCQTALTYIGYYRLSGYMISFYADSREDHIFTKGSNFEDIIKDYEFDQQLRLLCLSAIEKIEVAFRAVILDCMCLDENNSHWYGNKNYFKDHKYHSELITKLRNEVGKLSGKLFRRPKEKFIEHYHSKYAYPDLPPSWMIFETLSFGDVSFLFKNLHDRYKKKIACYFGEDDKILSSWIHSLCYLRNLCAHHSRIWNREMSIPPKIAKQHKGIQKLGKNNYFFGQAIIIKIILDKIDPLNTWSAAIDNTIKSLSHIRIKQMGFSVDWQKIFEKNSF